MKTNQVKLNTTAEIHNRLLIKLTEPYQDYVTIGGEIVYVYEGLSLYT